MLRQVIENTGITPDRTASLLGISPELFQAWMAEQRPIPHSVITALSDVVGTDLSAYVGRKLSTQEDSAITPAIWYRFRGERLVDEDRECVFLIRRLGYFINELEEVTQAKTVGWRALFQEIRQSIDIQAPPRIQGAQAASMFRSSRGLAVGAAGVGEVLRGNLRSMGALVIETPLPESQLEGCCFYVGSRPTERPCIFANSHHSSWFRRNMVLLHEVAHAIFDAESAGAALDFANNGDDIVAEQRADAFAQHVMVPKQVLQHVSQRKGINWRTLTAESLAHLVADTHMEQRAVLRAAFEYGLITDDELTTYEKLGISELLPSISTHALTTDDYIRTDAATAQKWIGKRNTTIPSRSIRLPASYIDAVLGALSAHLVSKGKAAEMLMVDDQTFEERFGGLLVNSEESEYA